MTKEGKVWVIYFPKTIKFQKVSVFKELKEKPKKKD